MKVKILVTGDKFEKEDLQSLIKAIREWELRTPRTTVTGVLVMTEPPVDTEVQRIMIESVFGVFPVVPEDVTEPDTQGSLLRLGRRIISCDGHPMGTIEEMTLSIAEASSEEVKRMQDARSIELIQMADSADMGMALFQQHNCRGCQFADKEKVGSGEACCTFTGKLETDAGVCKSRRPQEQPKEGGHDNG